MVSSLQPRLATKTRPGSLIQISSTGVYDVEEIKREEGGSAASSDTANDVSTVLGSSRAADCRGRHVGVG